MVRATRAPHAPIVAGPSSYRHARWYTAALLAGLIGAATPAVAGTVTVPGNYPTIQAAINAVISGSQPSGTVIQVQPGTYHEALVINANSKTFTVQGVAGAAATIIDADGTPSTTRQALKMTSATGTVRFEGLTFMGGNSTTWGGGIVLTASSPTFVNCIIENNSANDGGGANLDGSNATFTGCVFRNNTAKRFGGGLVIGTGSRPTFTNSTIQNNTSGTTSNIGSGGGLHINNSSPTMRNCLISGNQSKFAGGGIFQIGTFGSAYGVSTLVLEDSDVSGNTSSRFSLSENPPEGGGVHIENNSLAYVTRTKIRNNVAGTGGGLNTYRAQFEITDSTIDGNQATVPNAVGGYGGGIGATSNNITSPLQRAAIVTVTRSAIRNNSARKGGGILISGDQVCGGVTCTDPSARKATLTINDSLVDNNSASEAAGGISAFRTVFTLTQTQVIRNRVLQTSVSGPFGGGAQIAQSTVATITNAVFAGNTAGNGTSNGHGGALFIESAANVTISSSKIYANSAWTGGGVYVGSSGPPIGKIQTSVIADNANYQIHEQACSGSPILEYRNNSVTNQGSLKLYKSTCTFNITSISAFNALPGGKVSGNNGNAPNFVSFMAVPPVGTSVLSWVVARATTVTISGLGNFSGAIGTTSVSPSGGASYTLTASTSNGSAGPVTVNVAGTGQSTYLTLGGPADVPVPADYDGDNEVDHAVFGTTTAVWKIRRSSDGVVYTQAWGSTAQGDTPVPGDFDGDGKADLAVYRKTTGVWYVKPSSGIAMPPMTWGTPSLQDVPLAGDFDGDGKADFAVFRKTNALWYIRQSSNGVPRSEFMGSGSTDVPVPADFDGDFKTDIAVYRTSNGQWYVRRSSGGSFNVGWGSPAMNDQPMPADYDGDGKADVAYYRKTTGDWGISNSSGGVTVTNWGSPAYGDVPVPHPFTGGPPVDIAIWRPSDGTWRY